jgi:hypothetical protein
VSVSLKRTGRDQPGNDHQQLDPKVDVHVVLRDDGPDDMELSPNRQQHFFRLQNRGTLGRFPPAWAAAAELAGLAEPLSLRGQALDLVGVVDEGPRGHLFRPDFAAGGHAADVRNAASVDFRGFLGAAYAAS